MNKRVEKVRDGIVQMLPAIIEECLGEDESIEYYQSMIKHGNSITDLIKEHFGCVGDFFDLYTWLGLPTKWMFGDDYNGKGIIEFLLVYTFRDNGLSIIDKLTTDLMELQTRFILSYGHI